VSKVRKYLKTIELFVKNNIEFRFQLFGFILTWILSTLSVIALWIAVYEDGGKIGEFSFEQIVMYYFAILIVSFVTELYFGQKLAFRIKDGLFSSELLKPQVNILRIFCEAVGDKIAYLVIPFPVFLGILYIINSLILRLSFAGVTIQDVLSGMLFCVLGFVINFLLEYLVVAFAFWIDEVWSLSHLKHIILSITGGVIFPIHAFSTLLSIILNLLPFQFVYFVPVMYITGMRSIRIHGLSDLILCFAWICILYITSSLMWTFGLKKYQAYGN
jgi:ABC-2 type transport system permease protein